jgi:4-amino-4-deoxy-L-arabinose transferase-like glycosyltransferase
VGIANSIRAAFSREKLIAARTAVLSNSLEALTLFWITAFFLFYGLVPVFGGAALGLVGADEPRYAEVAREMLARNDFVTPILYGKPWLEKPALYYWRAMFSFREFGIHDWSARLPSASFAFTLIVLIYLHMRRFRPGGQLDAALITASCAGFIAFSRGASTDMQLAAPFCIGMLGWYAWYETDSKFWLFDLYFFVGAATLAKGPVAPFMAIAIILSFTALRREWSLLRRSIWIPGIILYLAMVLPWFIAVQRRNPIFLRVFFLQHNLERFATDLYKHEQGAWYYLPVMLLGLMPWAVIAVAALVDAVQGSFAEWRARRAKNRYIGHHRPGDAFPEFLVLWALFPIVFFSFSKSKLPGYVLPSIPALTILAGDYLNRKRHQGLQPWLLVIHAVLTGGLAAVVLLLPGYLQRPGVNPSARAIAAASLTGVGAAMLILVAVANFGIKRLRIATLVPIVMLLFFLLGVGPFFGIGPLPGSKNIARIIDEKYSARPLYRMLKPLLQPGEILAVYQVRRDMEYGLSFYNEKQVLNYNENGAPAVPDGQHILVVRESYAGDLRHILQGRSYQPLFTYPAQGLIIYSVAARSN